MSSCHYSAEDVRESIVAALMRERLCVPRRPDEDVLRQILSETDYCENSGSLSESEAAAWRDEVSRHLHGGAS
jgi:hypothetical protein